MFSSLLGAIGFDLKRQARHIVMTVVFALVGAILIALALGFGIAALYEWLKHQYGTLPALGIMGGAWAVLGIIFLCLAFSRPDPRRRPAAVAANPLQQPAAAFAQATEQAVDSATGLIREGSRQVFGVLLVAAMAGSSSAAGSEARHAAVRPPPELNLRRRVLVANTNPRRRVMDARKLVLPAAVFVGGALLGRLIGLKGLARAGMAALTLASASETAGLLTSAGKRAPARRAVQRSARKRSAPKRSTTRKSSSKSAGIPAGAQTH